MIVRIPLAPENITGLDYSVQNDNGKSLFPIHYSLEGRRIKIMR